MYFVRLDSRCNLNEQKRSKKEQEGRIFRHSCSCDALLFGGEKKFHNFFHI